MTLTICSKIGVLGFDRVQSAGGKGHETESAWELGHGNWHTLELFTSSLTHTFNYRRHLFFSAWVGFVFKNGVWPWPTFKPVFTKATAYCFLYCFLSLVSIHGWGYLYGRRSSALLSFYRTGTRPSRLFKASSALYNTKGHYGTCIVPGSFSGTSFGLHGARPHGPRQ